MKTYSKKFNAERAAKTLGLNVATLTFIKTESGWGWEDPKPEPKPEPAATPAFRGEMPKLLEMLQSETGVTIKEAAVATGWQERTTRARISATIAKTLKMPVTSEKIEGRGRVYRISA